MVSFAEMYTIVERLALKWLIAVLRGSKLITDKHGNLCSMSDLFTWPSNHIASRRTYLISSHRFTSDSIPSVHACFRTSQLVNGTSP